MMFRPLLLFVLLLFLLSPVCPMAQEHQQCIMCGMDLTKYTHVRYQIIDTGGNTYTTCGVQCGLLLQLNLKDKFKSATATDLFNHKTLPADKAWYVYRSTIITDMGPGFIAFASRDHANRFVTGFGGKVVNWQQALDIVKKGFK